EPATLATRLTPFALTVTRHRFFILIVIIIIVVVLFISESTTAYLLFHRTRWFPFASNWLAVIPGHAFSPQHTGAKARFSVLPSVDRRRNLSIFCHVYAGWRLRLIQPTFERAGLISTAPSGSHKYF